MHNPKTDFLIVGPFFRILTYADVWTERRNIPLLYVRGVFKK